MGPAHRDPDALTHVPFSAGTPTTASSFEDAVVGIHLDHIREREAEHDGLELAHALRKRGLAVSWVATHRTVTASGPAVSLSFAGPVDRALLQGYVDIAVRERGVPASDPDRLVRAAQAGEAFRARVEGRVVAFPGQDSLGEAVTVAELLAGSAIDEIATLGNTVAADDDRIVTRNFVRPRLSGGKVVLHLQPARGGTFVPFETPEPTPCCADHS